VSAFLRIRSAVATLFWVLVALWVVVAVNTFVFGGSLAYYGIAPRSIQGLRGIVFGPFLHGNSAHLVGNTIGLGMFGGLVAIRSERHFWTVVGWGALVAGFGTWLFGRPSIHIGASGVIFALFGYLIATGWFERRISAILLSIVVLAAWGGMMMTQVLPFLNASIVSWEAHFFGLVGGVYAAKRLARPKSRAVLSLDRLEMPSRLRARFTGTSR
jgi:membrane associated rhomboid family serine protease